MSKMRLVSLAGLVISLALLLFAWHLLSPAGKKEPSAAYQQSTKPAAPSEDPDLAVAGSDSSMPALRTATTDTLGQALAVLAQHPDPDDPAHAAALEKAQKKIEGLDADAQIDAYQELSEILAAEP